MTVWTLVPTVRAPLVALQRVGNNLLITQRCVADASASEVNGVGQIAVTAQQGTPELLVTVVRSYFDVLGEGSVVVSTPGQADLNLTYVMYDRIWQKQANTMTTWA